VRALRRAQSSDTIEESTAFVLAPQTERRNLLAQTNIPDGTTASKPPRRVVVTGAANGLGLAIAKRLSRDGAFILLVDSDSAVLSRVTENGFTPERTFALVKDLSEPDAAPVVFERTASTIGLVDTLINNAAWSFHKAMQEVTVSEFDRVVSINQRAPFFLAQAMLQQISQAKARPRDPVIINIGSVNALAGNANLVPYAGTKGALTTMTRAMAVEMSPWGIRVNAICPAAIETYVTKNLIAAGVINPSQLFEKYLQKRFASCEEIAELVAYLCSDSATYVNGANWVIDGGYLAQ
jgi:meso-butanediol dehydrogenase / (S,S)-butanediol dehydrogenase / diacetyl reductase